MHKDIVLLDGISDDYLQSILKFWTEWESYSPVISITTSGSTGSPKTINFSKKQAEASARYTGRFFDFKPGDSLLLNLSPEFVAGKLMIVRALVHNLKLVVAPLQGNPFKNRSTFPEKIKLAAFVPHQVAEILKDPDACILFRQIEHVIIGGAAIPTSLEQLIAENHPSAYATFGMTETLTHFALRPIDGKTDYYTCLPGVQVHADERGCLVVEVNDILQESLVTNDLVECLDKTRFRWCGRYDFLINSGGVKIVPEADEKRIEHLFGAKRFYLTSKPSVKYGEEVVLVVEDEEQGGMAFQDRTFLSKLEALLPPYHAPKSVVVLSKFEETSNGKVKRKKF